MKPYQKFHSSYILAIALIMLCTVLTVTAQILLKLSFSYSKDFSQLITYWEFMLGIVIYAISALLLIIALKHGELSVVYPFIALGYILISVAAYAIFNEPFTILKYAGIFSIILGVSLIGLRSRK